MKKRVLNLAIVVLLLAGVIACDRNDEVIKTEELEEIDFSNIDFSNIANLCEQPVPVIEKAIQGKWKVYRITVAGVWFQVLSPEDSYIEFNDKYYVYWESGEIRDTAHFTWKKTAIADSRNPLKGQITQVMWKGNPENYHLDNWYFESILHDTLHFGGYASPNHYYVTRVSD
jgi:hypothetical protein